MRQAPKFPWIFLLLIMVSCTLTLAGLRAMGKEENTAGASRHNDTMEIRRNSPPSGEMLNEHFGRQFFSAVPLFY